MKKLLLIISTVLMGATSFAQTHFGIHGGYNYGAIKTPSTSNDLSNNFYGTGLGGVFVEIQAAKHFAVQPELNYIGYKTETTNLTENIKTRYLQLPILLKYMTHSGFNAFAGPQISFLTKANATANGIETNIKNRLTANDFSVVAGVEYNFLNGFILGGRYQHGFSNIYKIEASSNNTSRYRAVQFTLGYLFGCHRNAIKTIH